MVLNIKMAVFLFTLCLILSLLSIESSGSVIRNKSQKVKEGQDKNPNKTFLKVVGTNLNSSETTSKPESSYEIYDEQMLNKIEEFLRKEMMTSEKYPDVINYTTSGQLSLHNNVSLKSTTKGTNSKLSPHHDLGDVNKNFTNIDLSNGSLHATVNLKPLFTLDDGNTKQNYSKSEITGNLDKPLSISINLLVGNNVTIKKYYLSKNLTKNEHIDSYGLEEETELNKNENLDSIEDVDRRNHLGKKLDFETINKTLSKMISFIHSKNNQNFSTPFESDSETLTTTELNPINIKYTKLLALFSTTESFHYDDVDESGFEIGAPITFFPPEDCPTKRAPILLLQLVRFNNSLADSDSEMYSEDFDTNDLEPQVTLFPLENNIKQDKSTKAYFDEVGFHV